MTDERHDLGEQRHLGADGGVVLEHALAVVAPMTMVLPSSRTKSKLGDAGDVDQPLRPGEPHRHQRDESLSAGDDAHVVSGDSSAQASSRCAGLSYSNDAGFIGRALMLVAERRVTRRDAGSMR